MTDSCEINKNGSETKLVKDPIMSRSKKRLLCYSLVLALPVIQFCIFYIYINLNSVIMSFKQWDNSLQQEVFSGFDNFKLAFDRIKDNLYLLKYSLILYAVRLVFVLFLAIIFSYYISKNFLFARFFRIILYMPVMVSSIAFVSIFTALTRDVPTFYLGYSLLDENRFLWSLIFTVWCGFGTNVLLFTGAMSAIPSSLVESAQLDGANLVHEFIHITIPCVWRTFVMFIVLGLSGLFLDQMNLYTLFGSDAGELGTFGYYFYVNSAQLGREFRQQAITEGSLTLYILSAMGVIITVIIVPITLGVKKLLEKLGPSEN